MYDKKKYLQLLSKEYKNINEVTEEIINLKAILNLHKGTEVFLSDVHGEYEPFTHILNNGAGIIRSKIEETFENSEAAKQVNNKYGFTVEEQKIIFYGVCNQCKVRH